MHGCVESNGNGGEIQGSNGDVRADTLIQESQLQPLPRRRRARGPPLAQGGQEAGRREEGRDGSQVRQVAGQLFPTPCRYQRQHVRKEEDGPMSLMGAILKHAAQRLLEPPGRALTFRQNGKQGEVKSVAAANEAAFKSAAEAS